MTTAMTSLIMTIAPMLTLTLALASDHNADADAAADTMQKTMAVIDRVVLPLSA